MRNLGYLSAREPRNRENRKNENNQLNDEKRGKSLDDLEEIKRKRLREVTPPRWDPDTQRYTIRPPKTNLESNGTGGNGLMGKSDWLGSRNKAEIAKAAKELARFDTATDMIDMERRNSVFKSWPLA